MEPSSPHDGDANRYPRRMGKKANGLSINLKLFDLKEFSHLHIIEPWNYVKKPYFRDNKIFCELLQSFIPTFFALFRSLQR